MPHFCWERSAGPLAAQRAGGGEVVAGKLGLDLAGDLHRVFVEDEMAGVERDQSLKLVPALASELPKLVARRRFQSLSPDRHAAGPPVIESFSTLYGPPSEDVCKPRRKLH